MPQYVARKISSTKDGSSLDGGSIMVTADNETLAKQAAASQLGCSPGVVQVERYINHAWEALKRGG